MAQDSTLENTDWGFLKKCFVDADVENGLEDTGRGKGKLGQSETVAWTYIYYQM